VLLIALAVLVFVPLKYVYPSRTVTLMRTTLLLGAFWGIQMLLMIWWLPNVPAWLLWTSPIFPVYYFALSLWLNLRPTAD
jgi:phosphatidylcholine synthase